MSKKDLINAIEVKSPCHENWDEMQGNDQVRFCSHCAKDVNNLSEMTRKEALRLVRRSEGRLCVRYINDPKTNRPLFAENLYKITRRAPGLAAGVMAASISLSTAAYSQGGTVRAPLTLSDLQAGVDPAKNKSVSNGEKVRVSGSVTDAHGKSLPGATVTLRDTVTLREETTTTNEGGFYELSVRAGKYTFVSTASGFETYTANELSILTGETVQNAAMKAGSIKEVITVTSSSSVVISLPKIQNPLSLAVQNDDPDETRNILSASVNVNVTEKNYEGATPLFMAVENGNVEVAKMLLNFGAKVNARNNRRQTPLMMLDGDATAALVDLLVANGARLDLADNQGNTALILAAEEESHISVIKALIDAGANVNHQNNQGKTALWKAADNDDLKAVRALLLAGADVNAKDNFGETAWDRSTDPIVTALLESYGGRSGSSEEEAAPAPGGGN